MACNSENPGPRLEPLRNLRDYQRKELETAEEQEIRLREARTTGPTKHQTTAVSIGSQRTQRRAETPEQQEQRLQTRQQRQLETSEERERTEATD